MNTGFYKWYNMKCRMSWGYASLLNKGCGDEANTVMNPREGISLKVISIDQNLPGIKQKSLQI
ncbi:hypothetical protein SAMN05660236_4758 [Ohtaekwangia koreensis]|uniref:Uncharacterized protein n=1 Tax=Ohtaekwangia koreensis TaxID=688867 RepID=A0A1T5M926_9BACT|nr:hypothetical protein SAMN05660236_4758 [Ohtaekwangia koreensis]